MWIASLGSRVTISNAFRRTFSDSDVSEQVPPGYFSSRRRLL